MTRKQIALIIGVNALISTLVSVIVVLLVSQLGLATWIAPDRATAGAAERESDLAIAGTTTISGTAAVQAVVTPIIHVIQTGDTITGLALQYDVPTEDIIAANNLENPNFLTVGVELIIPVGGVPETTATLTPAPTGTDTPIPFEPPSVSLTGTAAAEAGATLTPASTTLPTGNQPRIEITEVIEVGNVEQESVVFANLGDGPADLSGWTLSDAGSNTYTFARLTLWPGGTLTLYSGPGEDDVNRLFWGASEAIWSPGETATLRDNDGELVASFTIEQ